MSDRNLEQRINIKFCVKLGKGATETLQMLREAFGDDAMKKSRVFEWHKRFKEGREFVTDDPRSGQPKKTKTDVNIKRVRDAIMSHQQISVRLISEELQINRETVRQIVSEELADLSKKRELVGHIVTEQSGSQSMVSKKIKKKTRTVA